MRTEGGSQFIPQLSDRAVIRNSDCRWVILPLDGVTKLVGMTKETRNSAIADKSATHFVQYGMAWLISYKTFRPVYVLHSDFGHSMSNRVGINRSYENIEKRWVPPLGMGRLTPKHAPHHVRYRAEFGRSASKCVSL